MVKRDGTHFRSILSIGVLLLLAGCAPSLREASPPPRLTPGGVKEFQLLLDRGQFWPSFLIVDQGDTVRLVLTSLYTSTFFSFNRFNVHRLLQYNQPEAVEFVADEAGWFDFRAEARSALRGKGGLPVVPVCFGNAGIVLHGYLVVRPMVKGW
ncbi:MAG: hypothetical protein ACK4Z6_02090 [Candidatus Methylomirabilales bacterium]